jgi:hypothetical protein
MLGVVHAASYVAILRLAQKDQMQLLSYVAI